MLFTKVSKMIRKGTQDKMSELCDQLGKLAYYDQLAEEAAELCQAALKMKRVYNKTTDVSMEDAMNNLKKEMSDVLVCMEEVKCLEATNPFGGNFDMELNMLASNSINKAYNRVVLGRGDEDD